MPKRHEKEYSKTLSVSQNETVKESRDVSNIFTLLDSQPVKTNPFGANITGENSYRRAERISAALHLITNHVPESEALRTVIRAGGLELLRVILELRTGFRTISSEKTQAALASIRSLISYVRLLAVAGFVSAQNVSITAEALDELGSLIVVSQRSTLAEQLTITRDDLTPSSQGISSSTGQRSTRAARGRNRRPFKDIKDSESDEVSDTNVARAEQIMDILKVGGVLGIKDISSNLPQYSEKMVQRELANLVHLNKVSKVGAKRWSRYQIVS